MNQKKTVRIYVASDKDIMEKMALCSKEGGNIRDFFLEEILKKHISGFSLEDICRNEHGKPLINTSQLSFNLSHSRGYFALVLSNSESCGVDIQFKENREKFDDALKSVLTDREYKMLSDIKSDDDFFQMWSVKEAYIKAKGSSIWFGRDYDFSELLPNYSSRWIYVNGLYLYSEQISPSLYLSVFLSEMPDSVEFLNF